MSGKQDLRAGDPVLHLESRNVAAAGQSHRNHSGAATSSAVANR